MSAKLRGVVVIVISDNNVSKVPSVYMALYSVSNNMVTGHKYIFIVGIYRKVLLN